jgi:Cof subfamily protein (haloacid dehalogenase superfamily)
MSYQVLALDLDGTLTNSKKEITAQTKEALIDIQKKGKTVVLASGRPDVGIIHLAKELELEHFGGYMLSFNGARIVDCKTGTVLYNRTVPKEVIRPTYEYLLNYKDKGVGISTYTENTVLGGIQENKYIQLEAKINNIPIEMTDDFPNAITWNANKFMATGDHDVLVPIHDYMIDTYHSLLNIYFSEPFFLEFMPQNIDKAYSLQKLMTHLGLTANNLICCGDGYNDVTMIEYAGLGVAMENAQSLLLEKADFVTKSNDNEGILYVIDRFMRD